MSKKNKTLIYSILAVFILLLGNMIAYADVNIQGNIVEDRYSTVLPKWEKEVTNNVDGVKLKITPSHFVTVGGKLVEDKTKTYNYHSSVMYMQTGNTLNFKVNAPEEGLYNLSFDYFILNDGLLPNEIGVKVNGNYQYFEAKSIALEQYWESVNNKFSVDRFGNEVISDQRKLKKWYSYTFEDPAKLQPKLLKFKLLKGANDISITVNSGELLAGDITVFSENKNITYKDYQRQYESKKENNNVLIKIEAEKPSYKTDTAEIPVACRDLEVTPYDTNKLLLNTFGGSSWSKGGQAISYNINVPESGLYKLGIKYILTGDAFRNKALELSTHENTSVYRTIMIDGEVPFNEMENYAFKYTTKWKTEILGADKKPYKFYLSKGNHTITLKVDTGIFCSTINTISTVLNEVNTLALQIKKLVGNESDKYIDWNMTDYFPDIKSQLENMNASLKLEYDRAVMLNNGDRNSNGLISIQAAMKQIEILENNPNDIPKKISMLNDGNGSITKKLVTALSEYENQPLQMDQLYLFNGDQKLPSYNVPFYRSISEGIKRFIHSFTSNNSGYISSSEAKNKVVINVWVNRARNYVDLMQKMADDDFTAKTGIKVNFTIMPDEGKLILANASGTSPDVALGISNYLPYDMGIRGALYNLKDFKDYNQVIKSFSPGSLVPMISDGKCYGLPETQDAYVLFYRKDILDSLKIPVPNTWQDVVDILPELQRSGMNFYCPIGGPTGLKAFATTSPFIYQNGGKLYNENGMTTALDSKEDLKGIKLMTDLYTIYGMPMQVPNFYEHFKDGSIPIGISNFSTYIQLNIAAPELKGSWAIAPSPGIRDSKGVIERWQTGSAQSTVIFNNTKYPKESWEFLKWWLSYRVQSDYANKLQILYGDEYLWNTSNLQAFKEIPMPKQDKDVVLKQWEWLKEVEKTPASYVLERELSNTWDKVVLEGKNLRASVDEAVLKINKELSRKMEEFGYIKNGKVIKPYKLPSIEEIKGWEK